MKVLFLSIFITAHAWGFDHGHTKFIEVLGKNVVRKGSQTLVNYKAIKKDPVKLKQYLQELSTVTKKEYQGWSKDEKLAALINGYNAWTIQLIVDNYPVSSIKKIGPFYSTPWKKEFISWLGEKRSLDDIEHGIIRKEFNEPRIHFALVCAALGCPTLQEKPFVASKLESNLKKASDEFLQDTSKNIHVISGDEVLLNVSSIFKWYGEDFGPQEALITYITKGMGISDKVNGKKIKLDYLEYNWSLNDVK